MVWKTSESVSVFISLFTFRLLTITDNFKNRPEQKLHINPRNHDSTIQFPYVLFSFIQNRRILSSLQDSTYSKARLAYLELARSRSEILKFGLKQVDKSQITPKNYNETDASRSRTNVRASESCKP